MAAGEADGQTDGWLAQARRGLVREMGLGGPVSRWRRGVVEEEGAGSVAALADGSSCSVGGEGGGEGGREQSGEPGGEGGGDGGCPSPRP